MSNPFKCDKCTDALSKSRNCDNELDLSEEARLVEHYTEEVKEEILEKNAQKVFTTGGVRFYECPLTYLTHDTNQIMRLLYTMEHSGHLLHPGGLADQPHWLIESMEVFRLEQARQSREPKDNNGNSKLRNK